MCAASPKRSWRRARSRWRRWVPSTNIASSGRRSRRRCAMAMHRVVVAGAAGRMGRAAVRTIARRDDMTLVGALGRSTGVGQDAGVVAGAGAIGVPVGSDLGQIFLVAHPTVLLDFSHGEAAV